MGKYSDCKGTKISEKGKLFLKKDIFFCFTLPARFFLHPMGFRIKKDLTKKKPLHF